MATPKDTSKDSTPAEVTPLVSSGKPRKKLTQKLKRVEVELDDGVYTCYELMSRDLGQWRSEMADRGKLMSSGELHLQNFQGVESSLICRCMKKNSGESVEAAIIDTWPSSTVTELFKICQELNGMTQEAAEAVKKA